MNQEQQPFAFTGQGGEYFRIWIVNLCLSIISLGIYSAWAKVRRQQYFYRHTSVAGAAFDYHGNPRAILKGRIIAAILFGTYSLAGHISPIAALGALVLLMAVMPWLLVRSLKFRLHNTSYRALRFSFHGSTGNGYVNFLLLPLVSYLSLGLLWPLAHQQITCYTRDNSQYANTRFKFHGKAGTFYKPYLLIYGATFITFVVVAVTLALAYARAGLIDPAQLAPMLILVILGTYLLILFLVIPYLAARLQNIIWNNTSLGEHRFSSNARARDLLGITLSNIMLIILTLGLFKPFADIRMARYKIERITLIPSSDFEEFFAVQEAEVQATGEEVADFFDMDIAL
jgi:uncharacterized membrane protein YjgN (DUF898 family)